MTTASSTPLCKIAKTIRSKNAGNHYYTFDIIFDGIDAYRNVRDAGVITRELIARLYAVPVDQIVDVVHYDPGNAIKITMRRPISSGDVGESDVYGCQQYAPLLDIPIPRGRRL